MKALLLHCGGVLLVAMLPVQLGAQQPAAGRPGADGGAASAGASLSPDYVIGIDDVLSVKFWREAELSADVVVRPDGKISLPLLNDVAAAGYTPEQLGATLQEAAARFVADPSATVIVKEIHSRWVSVLGEVAKPGKVRLAGTMNVMQVIAEVGGFLEHAKRGDVVIIRPENGRERRFRFNYNDVLRGRRVEQNIALQPGDVVIVR